MSAPVLDALDALAPVLATGETERARVQHAEAADAPCPACRGGKTLRHLDGVVIACPRCGGSGLGGAVGQALARVARGDYDRWLEHVGRAGGCENPIRLAGEVTRVNSTTGEVVESYRSADAPDGVIYLPCNNRRASVCPACSEVYRYDTYNLVAAGLRGGKGVPETVGEHPCVFLTLTAPSFGAVHTHRANGAGKPLPCRPRRAKTLCPHGRATWCAKRHDSDAAVLGTPLCVACYDHDAAVVWNHFAPELWRYFRTYLPRELARLTGTTPTGLAKRVRLAYVKVGEYQQRGSLHWHAVIRLDAAGPKDAAPAPPPAGYTIQTLSAAIRAAARAVKVSSPPIPNPAGGSRVLVLRFGAQLDLQPVNTGTGDAVTPASVARYIGKYVTKDLDAPGIPDRRITNAEELDRLRCAAHYRAMIRAAWDLGGLPCPDCSHSTGGRWADCPTCDGTGHAFPRLRRWANRLGFGGHVLTKSRRYSTTFRALRRARRDHARAQRTGVRVEDLADIDNTETVTTLATWNYSGRGYHTTGDAWLAVSAAARAREHRRAVRELVA